MQCWNAILLFCLAWYAAYVNVGYKWKTLSQKSLPDDKQGSSWANRLHRLGLYLSFEAFWRTLYCNLAFAGASTAAVTDGYRSVDAFDFWKNPLVPMLLCLFVGASSQKWLQDDLLDKVTLSFKRLGLVVGVGILILGIYLYAVALNVLYASYWKSTSGNQISCTGVASGLPQIAKVFEVQPHNLSEGRLALWSGVGQWETP